MEALTVRENARRQECTPLRWRHARGLGTTHVAELVEAAQGSHQKRRPGQGYAAIFPFA